MGEGVKLTPPHPQKNLPSKIPALLGLRQSVQNPAEKEKKKKIKKVDSKALCTKAQTQQFRNYANLVRPLSTLQIWSNLGILILFSEYF